MARVLTHMHGEADCVSALLNLQSQGSQDRHRIKPITLRGRSRQHYATCSNDEAWQKCTRARNIVEGDGRRRDKAQRHTHDLTCDKRIA